MSLTDRLIALTLPVVPRPIVGRVAAHYIAGETLEDAVATVRELNQGGLLATVDVLGEEIRAESEADALAAEYGRLLKAIGREGLQAGVSVKLTGLGLDLAADRCRDRVERLVQWAADVDAFVRIDMEDSSRTDATLALHHDLRERGHGNVGVVLQACLRRTLADARVLADAGADVRLCKGIYREPEAIAHTDREAIRTSYLQSCEVLLAGSGRVAFATHDEKLVSACLQLAGGHERHEFQMLLGVQEGLRARLVAAGERMRVYVPYGRRWYEYSVRRLQENPRIAGHVARATLDRVFSRRPRGS